LHFEFVSLFDIRFSDFPFNGVAPQRIYIKRVLPALSDKIRQIPVLRLTSTSPACATWNFDQKLAQWSQILPFLGSNEFSSS
jgi:hypothetical protein